MKAAGRKDEPTAAQPESCKKYYGLGFGSNYFYSFGGAAVPLSSSRWNCSGSKQAADSSLSRSSGDENDCEWDPSLTHIFPLHPNEQHKLASTFSRSAANTRRSSRLHASSLAPPPLFSYKRSPMKKNTLLTCDSIKSDEGGDDDDETTDSAATTLPHPSTTQPIQALSAGATHTVSLTTNGELYFVGTLHGNTFPIPTLCPTRLPLKCTQVVSGRRHVLILVENGAVAMSWGSGFFGQLGHGMDTTHCPQPRIIERLLPQMVGGHLLHVAAGGLHSAAIVSQNFSHSSSVDGNNNSLPTRTFMWGSNRCGQCGVEGGKCNAVPYPAPLVPVSHPETGQPEFFAALSLGRLHSVGLTSLGQVYCWGSTMMGRCGHGDGASATLRSNRSLVSLPKRVEALRHVTILQIGAGDGHTLALSGSGRVFSWGCGSEGQLGHGHTMHFLSPRLVRDLDFAAIYAACNGRSGKLSSSHSLTEGDAEEIDISLENETEGGKIAAESSLAEKEIIVGGEDSDVNSSQRLAGLDICSEAYSDEGSALEAYPPTPRKSPHTVFPSVSTTESAPPSKITNVYAAGSYSAALSSSGDLYTWGYGDPGVLGHPLPKSPLQLPQVEPGPVYSTGTGLRIRDSMSFDSRLNVLLPRRIELTRKLGLKVDHVSAGPSHVALVCSERDVGDDSEPALTLFELERGRRFKGLNKSRSLGNNRLPGNADTREEDYKVSAGISGAFDQGNTWSDSSRSKEIVDLSLVFGAPTENMTSLALLENKSVSSLTSLPRGENSLFADWSHEDENVNALPMEVSSPSNNTSATFSPFPVINSNAMQREEGKAYDTHKQTRKSRVGFKSPFSIRRGVDESKDRCGSTGSNELKDRRGIAESGDVIKDVGSSRLVAMGRARKAIHAAFGGGR